MKENKAEDNSLIFILGITQRSGTNFLGNLLCLHPDCESPSPIYENMILEDAHILKDYADNLYSRWDQLWFSEKKVKKEEVYKALGSGLSSFLQVYVNNNKRIVTKSPSVKNLSLFFKLFPEAKLIILIRDGRSVVESYVKSFSFSYESAIRLWAERARIIIDFQKKNEYSKENFLIVKYESLVTDNEKEMHKILTFLDLDKAKYDFESAKKIPVSGSSELKSKGQNMHWEPVSKTPDFNPLNRFANWSISTQNRFNWIAGDLLSMLGYEKMEKLTKNAILNNKLLDNSQKVKMWLKNKKAKIRKRFM
jgi:protein-tyrosine sulfotransferase